MLTVDPQAEFKKNYYLLCQVAQIGTKLVAQRIPEGWNLFWKCGVCQEAHKTNMMLTAERWWNELGLRPLMSSMKVVPGPEVGLAWDFGGGKISSRCEEYFCCIYKAPVFPEVTTEERIKQVTGPIVRKRKTAN